MLDGFVRAAAAAPAVRVADCALNAEEIRRLMERAAREGVSFLCLPELCLTGYTCGDLFRQETLLGAARAALGALVRASAAHNLLVAAGLPLAQGDKLYNAAAVFGRGRLLGFVPKTHLPNYGEFYELRHFSPAPDGVGTIDFDGQAVPFGTSLLFVCEAQPAFRLAVELCEDLWTPSPPSVRHALAGATVLANLSAGDETIGKAAYRRALVAGQSARLVCGYVYAGAGRGESTTDMVFAGHQLICENGVTLAEAPPFADGWALSEIDLSALLHDRRRMNTFPATATAAAGYVTVPFSLDTSLSSLTRAVDPRPFVPADTREKRARCEEILTMQATGLATRLAHTGVRAALIGVSGGLDSCLALLSTVRAVAALARPLPDVLAVTMPCFGTTARTRQNAHRLCEALGVTCREIDISESVRRHLRDIGHPEDARDVVYENAQARVRTLVLMDLANQVSGLVVGTGDLSELALGWATYNGDHMSMYGVNAGVPKTLVRHIVGHVADTCGDSALAAVLRDILATPVSPELLPPEDGAISQQTEALVGPYELHDFFLYHIVRWGRAPRAVLALAGTAFAGVYAPDEIRAWLRVFCRRFFAQQFKRSCLPDGPKIGSVTLSPRGDWRMPSDAVCDAWLADLEAAPEAPPAP
ncbi:MAG: NAD(+) synthase [Oscillospiraceae bacterium]|nr:NAD(+) synthase [Oscillospiraceae bacterium]